MLQFILGRASTGKSYTVTEKIAECVKAGESVILLVPEQFSFESEKRILDRMGDTDAQSVKVLSFSRLCDEIERENGGICGITLTEADKNILMGKAVSIVKEELKRWGKYSSSSGFTKLLVDAVDEFKLNSVYPEELRSAAENSADEQLSAKLYDTALIYETFDSVIAERFVDPSDRLTKLYYTLENYLFFNNKTVFLDSFKGFTGQQYRIIERIISQSNSVTVSLAENYNDNTPFGTFYNIKKTRQRITNIAKSRGIKILEDIVLDKKFYSSPDLCALEEYMANGSVKYEGKAENINICLAENVYSEAQFVARNIRRIVREKGASYDDFVVIARDTEPYEEALQTTCEKNGISCFIDRRLPLSSLPPAVALLAAAELAAGITTEKILRFHKCGIGVLSFDEITALENYVYLWNIDGALWQNEWKMNPSGFSVTNTDENAEIETQRSAINELRLRAIMPIIRFRKKLGESASSMAQAFVELLEDCSARVSFSALADEYKSNGDPVFCDAMRRSWDNIMNILNSLTLCFGKATISVKEFCDAVNLCVSLDTVAVVPQMLDQVTFGAADRIRPSRPKYAFIMGANQGIFPRTIQNGGLFATGEREKLINLGIEITDNTLSNAVDEEFLLYSNICCASDAVFISCASNVDGASAEPSIFIEGIKNNFNCNVFEYPSNLSAQNIPETAEDAFSNLCQSINYNAEDASTLILALEDEQNIKSRVKTVLESGKRPHFTISRETSLRLFGNRLRMSASKFDSFNRCKFMYFCRYGLGAQKLQSAEFNTMQRGTLVHYVLQRAVEDYGKNLSALTTQQIAELVDRYINEYLDSIIGYREIENDRMRYLVSTMARTLKYVVERLSLEFAQSDFEPVKCELKIGYQGDIPEIKIPVEEYGDLILTGYIDRLDSWNGYVRIIDYKTGSRSFKLPDILVGQNMQMLIYLYAICKDKRFGEKPAGIFYMPSSRVKNGTAAKRRMNGLVSANEELVYAMEKENKGEFVPKLSLKNPSDSFIAEEDFNKIFDFVERKLIDTGKSIFEGKIEANPIDGIDKGACDYCEFAGVCRIEKEKKMSAPKFSNAEVIAEIERWGNNDV